MFDLKPEITDCENPIELKGLNNKIEFKNVNFEYIENKCVIGGINGLSIRILITTIRY